MEILGHSYLLASSNSESLYNLNDSIQELMKSNSTLQQFECIEFDIVGCSQDNDLALVVTYTMKNGKSGTELFTSHVDDGAITLYDDFIKAYYGIDKFNEFIEVIGDDYDTVNAEYLKENEPDLYNDLAIEYLLLCSPNVNNGAEFTVEDERFFNEILKGSTNG